MTNRRTHSGLMAVPGSESMASTLQELGFHASVTVANCNFGGSFGRRLPETRPDATPTQIAQIEEQRRSIPGMVRASVREAADALGLMTPDGSLPALTSVGFTTALHNLPPQDLVQVVTQPGYWPEDNPTKPSLAVIVPPGCNLNLMMPFADAPPLAIVAVVRMPHGGRSVIKAMIMGAYHFMWGEHQIVELTARAIEEVADRHNAVIETERVWGFTGPGASEHFDFNGRVRNEFRQADPVTFDRFTTFDPDRQDLFPPDHRRYDPENGYHQLNLRGLAAYRLSRVKIGGVRIRPENLGELAHNTKVELGCYASKRELLGDQHVDTAGRRIPSNAMFLVVN